MATDAGLIEVFCRATSAVKRTKIYPESMDSSSYLGGDLGIDSIEMLEIWYRMEKELRIHLPDLAKREIYTVAQVLEVFNCHILATATPPQ